MSMFTEMDEAIAHFYSGVDEFMLRYRIAQDVGMYLDECGLSAVIGSQTMKGLKKGIYSVITEGVERGEGSSDQ